MARAPLTTRRLLGLDRSGGPPPETRRKQPLNPWTVPNAIGAVRLALLPVFLAVALSSDDGQDTLAFVLFAIIATPGGDPLSSMILSLVMYALFEGTLQLIRKLRP